MLPRSRSAQRGLCRVASHVQSRQRSHALSRGGILQEQLSGSTGHLGLTSAMPPSASRGAAQHSSVPSCGRGTYCSVSALFATSKRNASGGSAWPTTGGSFAALLSPYTGREAAPTPRSQQSCFRMRLGDSVQTWST